MTNDEGDMKIACTMAPGRGDTDLLLERIANSLQRRGLRVRGTVQVNSDQQCVGPCDMDVCVLPDGPVIRISQSLGEGARGCRLNPEALETAVGLVSTSLEQPTDVLIINKFGKHEAEGRGFRPVIADALARGIPVLVGLNRLNNDAFEAFSCGLAENLPPDPARIEEWMLLNAPRRAEASRRLNV